MMTTLLPRITVDEFFERPAPVVLEPEALAAAERIVNAVEAGGWSAAQRISREFGECETEPRVWEAAELAASVDELDAASRGVLGRSADRIRTFAEAQRTALRDIDVPIPGGSASHRALPVARAGCYAPGGRYPLPSSVLMTAITARAAGVARVVVCSPRPTRETLAAASLAGADRLIGIGGAQAIAAMTFCDDQGMACDVICGPGNKYVTAAKWLVSSRVRIDMLAGPSELLIVADASADPALIAADLLAQAEHDTDASTMLIATSPPLLDSVEAQLRRQMKDLPAADIAQRALSNGFAVAVGQLGEAVELADRIAPEHLALHLADASAVAKRFANYGALFVGGASAEVLGDYAAGPNHTLPTGGTARFSGGLSVFNFLRVATEVRIDDAAAAETIARDAATFARMEHLEAHARSAERRLETRDVTASSREVGGGT